MFLEFRGRNWPDWTSSLPDLFRPGFIRWLNAMTHFVVIKSHHFLFVEVMFCLTSLASWCKVHLVTNMWAPSHLNATFKNLFFFPTSIVKSATPLPRVTTWFFYCLPGWLLLVPSVDVTSVFVPTTLLPYYFSQQNPQSANSCFIFFPHLINKKKQKKNVLNAICTN